MSTHWGYACVSHDPPIDSDRWFNHGEAALIDAFLKERAGQWPVNANPRVGLLNLPMPVTHRGYRTEAPIHWLREHPHCDVVLRNEYGDVRPIGQGVIAGARAAHEIEGAS